MNSIFICTALVLSSNSDQEDGPTIKSKWNACWFPTFEEAKKFILTGDNLFFEQGRYNLAVIEEFAPGFITTSKNEHWYKLAEGLKFDGNFFVESTNRPADFMIVNIGLG